ncbi:MAG: hypothetical protein KBT75_04100 [Oleispira antarctica]|nr:hypothetical protein [Oleispira antarctica]MBQ0791904.1 hypothetical protein [Oleispira antarctica]
MPLGIFLIWPALHLMYGLTEHRSIKINQTRRYAGRLLIAFSTLLMGQPFGFEKGLFYGLFALVALGLCFVQLRIWQPRIIVFITIASMLGFVLLCFDLGLNLGLDLNLSLGLENTGANHVGTE